MPHQISDRAAFEVMEALAREVAELGERVGLAYVAASADIGSPDPMVGADGRPLAETMFRWLDPSVRYWEDRGFALRAAFLHAARACAEPFHFHHGRFGSWRASRALAAINGRTIDPQGVGTAIIAPAYLPAGAIGAVVWATPDAGFDVVRVFDAHAEGMHCLALKFIAAYHDALNSAAAQPPARLTRREIQCLRWAAEGKTDADIARIVGISVPTVRFHMKNAWERLEVTGRAQAIRRAVALGYIGVRAEHRLERGSE